MTILQILEFPDPRLRTIAKTVETVDNSVRVLLDDMCATMYNASGIGLAATQIDIHRRIVVLDVSDTGNQPQVFINPEIIILDGPEHEYEEGCLSIPGFHETVSRPEKIIVKALDREGNPFELQPEGLLAVCIQHEVDHLNGKLFVDHISQLKRKRIRAKLEKQHKQLA